MRKRKVEPEVVKKKIIPKIKSDEESSNDNIPQNNTSMPNC